MSAKAAKAQAKAREVAARKRAGRGRSGAKNTRRQKGKGGSTGAARRTSKGAEKAQHGETASLAGSTKTPAVSGVALSAGRERDGAPPSLPVPIATFNI